MKTVLAYLAAAGSVLGSSSSAQDDASLGSVYARVGGGVSFVNDWDQDVTYSPDLGGIFPCPPGFGCPAVIRPTPDGQNLNSSEGIVATAAIGFDYADGIRTELEYRYASADIDSKVVTFSTAPEGVIPPDPEVQTPREDSINAHFILTNFYFDFTNSSPFTPFIGGGVGGAFVANENGDRDAVLAYQGRAGVSLTISEGFYLDGEYVYLRTNELAFGPDIEDLTTFPAIPNISGDRYVSSSVMMSLRKHF